MADRWRIPIWLVCGVFLLTRKEKCLGFVTNPALHQQRWCHENHHAHPRTTTSATPRAATGAAAAAAAATVTAAAAVAATRTTRAAAVTSSRTALHATGFGPTPPKRRPRASTPDPSAYYPSDDGDTQAPPAPELRDEDGEIPFPKVAEARKVEEPRGIGTLFESEDEVIRELSSEEYLDVLRDWAPIASFASVEAIDPKVKEEASCILTVLRGMAEWQPKRNADYTKLGSKWSFGAPIGAIKGGQVDALACLQVSEDEGVVVEWICGNPVTLGIPGNAVEWLAKGVHALCRKRLDLPVRISPKARGEGGEGDRADGGGGGGRGGGGGGGWGSGKSKRKADGSNSGSGGKKKSGSKKR